jgi:uncharacterized membrane protein YedE/YeeE
VVAPKPYANPYLAGTGLGLVLLAAFVVAGRGLGASGAFVRVSEHLHGTGGPLFDWIVVEIIGVVAGGWLSARLAGRWRIAIERAGQSAASRLLAAAAGGVLMGVGAVLARGCTSGLGLTGGAMLSVGSWLFIAAAFAAGYATMPLVRRAWR